MSQAKTVQLSLKALREDRYLCWKTEYWQATPYSEKTPGVRKDLFGITDIIALHLDMKGTLHVQCCAKSDISAHVKKAKETRIDHEWLGLVSPLEYILKTGNKFWIHGWDKPKNKWALTTKEFILKNNKPYIL